MPDASGNKYVKIWQKKNKTENVESFKFSWILIAIVVFVFNFSHMINL